jgi:outer membrane protein assembly factor BamB
MKQCKLFFLLSALLLLFSIPSFSQSNIKTYNLSDSVYSLYVDTCLHHQYVLFTSPFMDNGKKSNSTQNMTLFNLQTQQVQWTKPYKLDYLTKNSLIWLTAKGVLVSQSEGYMKKNSVSLLDYKDGNILWKKKAEMLSLEPLHEGLLIRTINSLLLTSKLVYLDLKTGNQRWSSNILSPISASLYQGGFNYVNDSLMYVIGDNILLIHLNDGRIQDYQADTQSFWRGTTSRSNLIFNDSCFYMSDRKKIFCLNKDLHEKWTCQLPNKSASLSYIYTDSAKVYMVNHGVGVDYKLRAEGYPFVAAFDKKTGKQLFFTQMADAKKPALDFFRMGDTQFMLFDNSIASCKLQENTALSEIVWDTKKYGALYKILTNNIYVTDGDSTHYTKISPLEKLLVTTQNGTVCELDPLDMRVVASYAKGHYLNIYSRYKNNVVLAAYGSIIILNEKGERQQVVDHILFPVTLVDNSLYIVCDNLKQIKVLTL